MERNANYALVGFIFTVLLIATLVFVLWLTNFAFSQRYDTYDVVFHGPISGLSRGGDVQFNGIKVGEVSDITLDAADPNLVHAKARVRSDTPVRVDSVASLEPQGITGVSFVQITAGSTSKPLLKSVTPFGKTMVIQSKPGALTDLLAGGGTLVQRAVETLNRINQVLSDENIQRFSDTLDNIRDVTAELRKRKQIIADADHAIVSADAAAVQITSLAKSAQGLVDTNGKQTLTKITDAATQIEGAASDVRGMLDKLKGPTSDFATTGLPELTSAIASLQTATNNLNRLITEVESNPRGFVNKPAAKQVEVKP
ncbi:MAG TPA: MlaD family protein [Caulobacteraceae bacterium]|nr:MlaD family protein [Caulobacteraceae bacterium]